MTFETILLTSLSIVLAIVDIVLFVVLMTGGYKTPPRENANIKEKGD